jgi:flagellar biosynthesis protein FlhG
LSELNELADVILIDTGAGVSDQVLKFVMASPEVLLITTPEPSSLTDAYSLLKAMYRNPSFVSGETSIRVISNRVLSKEEGRAVYEKLNSVVEQFLHGSLDYLGMVPQDPALERSVRAQRPVSMNAPNSPSARAFETLAGNLLNGTDHEVQVRWGIAQMFSSFLLKK